MSYSETATIQRCPHDPENPWAQISRYLIRDENISPECRWLIIYILSMKDGWEMRVSQIYKHTKKFIGREKIYKLINEGIEAGYISKEIIKVGNLNRGCRYYVSESPKFKKCFRHPSFQDAGGRDPEKPEALSNNKYSSKEEIHKKEHLKETPPNPQKGADPGGSGGRLSLGLYVNLEKKDYEAFCSGYGKKVIDDLIEEINDYLASEGRKPYKDYAATIRNWIRKRQRESKAKQEKQAAQKKPDLNPAQQTNYDKNTKLVDELKTDPDLAHKCSGMYFFHKTHSFRDSKHPQIEISGLVDHRTFCRFLDKHYQLITEKVQFHEQI